MGPIALGAAITGLGLFFLVGAFAVAGDAAYAGVGPRAFPVLVGAGLAIAGAVFTWQALPARVALPGTQRVDRRALAWIIGGLALAIATIQPLGFPVTAAILFVTTSRAFGSHRPARDAALGLVVGAIVYFAFARALGVTLPGGPLDWAR